ncbi:MAG: DUF2784 domain-containing protein [Nitrospiraceae bacterium]|nr:DUF2784 domain-containing protein [Nitrospiraceae bacterium]
MVYRLLADLTVLIHLGFVLFVVAGGLLVWRWPSLAKWHLPAAAWGALVEFTGWICPLTPLEQWLWARGGAQGSEGDFVTTYLLPILYPATLTRTVQLLLGTAVLLVNGTVYVWVWRRWRRR